MLSGGGDGSDGLDALLAASARGEPAAFAELFDATSRRIYGLVLRIVGDPGFAEEIVQETYLQIWDRADGFDRSQGSALGWMLTIAHRRAVDRVRSESAARRRDLRDAAMHRDGERDVAEEVVSTVDAERRSLDVRKCIDGLTGKQREAIELAYFDGRTYSQVAEHVGAALPTVKSRIRDGLRNLKICLGGVGA